MNSNEVRINLTNNKVEIKMDGRFFNKTALVTGAASGIGRATALAFAGEGAQVIAADLNLKGCQEVAALIKTRAAKRRRSNVMSPRRWKLRR